jgi:hypothetical protein
MGAYMVGLFRRDLNLLVSDIPEASQTRSNPMSDKPESASQLTQIDRAEILEWVWRDAGCPCDADRFGPFRAELSGFQVAETIERFLKWQASWGSNCVSTPAPQTQPEGWIISESLRKGLWEFLNRRFDGDRLIQYQRHFMLELERLHPINVSSAGDSAPQEAKKHLQRQAYESILARAAQYNDPSNEDFDWRDAGKWERHAMNAVLDLVAAESARDTAEHALRNLLAVVFRDGGQIAATFHELKEAAACGEERIVQDRIKHSAQLEQARKALERIEKNLADPTPYSKDYLVALVSTTLAAIQKKGE